MKEMDKYKSQPGLDLTFIFVTSHTAGHTKTLRERLAASYTCVTSNDSWTDVEAGILTEMSRPPSSSLLELFAS